MTAPGMTKKYVIGLCVFLILAAGVWSQMSGFVEQAPYRVVGMHGALEIRDYSPIIVAEVDVSGDRKESVKKGFRLLARYIFGHNQSSLKIPMTAPVIQQKCASGHWRVRFMMPAAFTLQTLPKPHNPEILLKALAARRFAVVVFSGIPTTSKLIQQEKQLLNHLSHHELTPTNTPLYAFYNPPWTLPFLRRNEVMVEVKSESALEETAPRNTG